MATQVRFIKFIENQYIAHSDSLVLFDKGDIVKISEYLSPSTIPAEKAIETIDQESIACDEDGEPLFEED